MRKIMWLTLGILLCLSVVTPSIVYAASSLNLTITATPLYLCITNTPNTWTLNGLTGSGKISPTTTYYANPLGDVVAPPSTVNDSSCQFNVTCCTGATTCELTVNVGNFSGGNAVMNNSNSGSASATEFGAYSWYSGMSYASKVLAKNTGSDKMYTTGLAADASLLWGAEIATRTTDFTGNSASTSIMTITATEK